MYVGLQLYSVRDSMAADFEGTLKAVHEMGYQGVEFAGIFDKTPEQVKALCEKYDLVPISAHVSIDDMLNIPGVFEDYKKIGCKFIAVPYMPPQNLETAQKRDEMIELVRSFAVKAKAAGLQLVYHNHDFEFNRFDQKEYFLDRLYSLIDADLLETELDTCWVKVAGEDPVKYLKKYSSRAHIVHLKDFYKKGDNVEGMYELIGVKPTEAEASAEAFGFRPLGKGMQDMPAIIKASEEAGAEWVIVEQDRPTPGKEPMDEVKISADYLKSQGLI